MNGNVTVATLSHSIAGVSIVEVREKYDSMLLSYQTESSEEVHSVFVMRKYNLQHCDYYHHCNYHLSMHVNTAPDSK